MSTGFQVEFIVVPRGRRTVLNVVDSFLFTKGKKSPSPVPLGRRSKLFEGQILQKL